MERVKFILDWIWFLWDECERIVRWLWDGFEMIVRWLWGGFEMIVRLFWDDGEMVLRWYWDGWDDIEMVEMIVRWLNDYGMMER